MAEPYFEIVKGVLIKYKGPGGVLRLPAGIRKIAQDAIYGQDDITEIIMSDSIEELEFRAIGRLKNLKRIQFSKGLKVLEGIPLCENVEQINLPEGLREIKGLGEFPLVHTLKIPESVETISNYAIGCPLDEIVLPSGICRLGDNVFQFRCGNKTKRITILSDHCKCTANSLTAYGIPIRTPNMIMSQFPPKMRHLVLLGYLAMKSGNEYISTEVDNKFEQYTKKYPNKVCCAVQEYCKKLRASEFLFHDRPQELLEEATRIEKYIGI